MKYLAAVVMIGLLVFIHEFGHFIVAKACGVEVRVLSIGFGRRLIGFRWGTTDYRLSMLPFGGYVLMAGADPFGDDDDDEIEDPERAYQRRPVWQRLLVSAAGPAFNLVLPFIVFTAVLMGGEPQPDVQVGSVDLNTPAHDAGVLPGDRVLAIDGQAVGTWVEVAGVVETLHAGTHSLTVSRDGVDMQLEMTLSEEQLAGHQLGMSYTRPAAMVGVDDPSSPAGLAGLVSGDILRSVNGQAVSDWVEVNRAFRDVGDVVELEVDGEQGERELRLVRDPDWRPLSAGRAIRPAELWGLVSSALIVSSVSPTLQEDAGILAGCRPQHDDPPAPAQIAGILPGDRFLSLAGLPVQTWNDVLTAVRQTMEGEGEGASAHPIEIRLVRQGRVISVDLTPLVVQDIDTMGRYYYRPLLGVVGMGTIVSGPQVRIYYPPGEALGLATDETLALGGFIVEQIGKLLTGEAAMDHTLGGPIEMVRQAGLAAERGIFAYARLIGMLSISLGIVNLLPVPVLDGGQILFVALEGIRGRPVSLALRERAQQIGVLFLVLLMLFVVVFDVRRLFESMGQ